jgi:hypothetical protein
MGLIVGVSGVGLEVDPVFHASRASERPLDYGVLGHYRVQLRILSTAAQVANARIFEVRNNGANLMVLTRLVLKAIQAAAGTAQENSLDAYKLTGFSAIDTTNTNTPVVSVKRGATMGAPPGNLQFRYTTAIAAGMTGGTLAKETTPFASLPYNVSATALAAGALWGPYNAIDDVNGTHPYVFAQNEGFDLENRLLNVTSYGIAWFIDCCVAEIPVSSF